MVVDSLGPLRSVGGFGWRSLTVQYRNDNQDEKPLNGTSTAVASQSWKIRTLTTSRQSTVGRLYGQMPRRLSDLPSSMSGLACKANITTDIGNGCEHGLLAFCLPATTLALSCVAQPYVPPFEMRQGSHSLPNKSSLGHALIVAPVTNRSAVAQHGMTGGEVNLAD